MSSEDDHSMASTALSSLVSPKISFAHGSRLLSLPRELRSVRRGRTRLTRRRVRIAELGALDCDDKWHGPLIASTLVCKVRAELARPEHC